MEAGSASRAPSAGCATGRAAHADRHGEAPLEHIDLPLVHTEEIIRSDHDGGGAIGMTQTD